MLGFRFLYERAERDREREKQTEHYSDQLYAYTCTHFMEFPIRFFFIVTKGTTNLAYRWRIKKTKRPHLCY